MQHLPQIKDLISARKVNDFYGLDLRSIRQRFIERTKQKEN